MADKSTHPTAAEKVRLLVVSPHVTQNPEPFKLLGKRSDLKLLVAYCSLPGEVAARGAEYLNRGVFDVPALEGYPWVQLKNRSPHPALDRSWGLINFGVVGRVRQSDVAIVYGYRYVSCWMAICAAKIFRKKLFLTSDAVNFGYHASPRKTFWKSLFLRFLYRLFADGVLVPSTASLRFTESLGVPNTRIFLTPYVVDNDGIRARAAASNRAEVRKRWGIPGDAAVITFISKFIPRKRPEDLLEAAAKLSNSNWYLVFVGDGPLRADLERRAALLGVESRLRFPGFVAYSELPSVYAASDVLVHPAEHEPYGLVVNEAMVCGCPVIASDAVGAAGDLIEEGKTGLTYPVRDIDALTAQLKRCLDDRSLVCRLKEEGGKKISTWSSRENAAAVAAAVIAAHGNSAPIGKASQ